MLWQYFPMLSKVVLSIDFFKGIDNIPQLFIEKKTAQLMVFPLIHIFVNNSVLHYYSNC